MENDDPYYTHLADQADAEQAEAVTTDPTSWLLTRDIGLDLEIEGLNFDIEGDYY